MNRKYRFVRFLSSAALLAGTITLALPAAAQTGAASGAPGLAYNPGSSVKLEQVIGDCDLQAQAEEIVAGHPLTCTPTTSRTITRFNIAGNGQGGSFEDNGKTIFFFGDTISNNPSVVNYHAADPIAWSASTDPEQGLLLNFYTNSNGSPLFVQPPGIKMAGDDIPNSGISLNGQIYLICNTGSDTTLANPQAGDYSALVQFNEAAQTFTAGRTISPAGGRFIGTSMHASGSNVFIFGAGPYRASDIYLQMVPASSFASGAGTQYFAGLVNGQPAWAGSESGAVPVVQDNPLNGPAWPNDSPTAGNLSVVYSSALNLWFMTYDGGRQSNKTRGVYFTYAPQPWGPWATPQLIFSESRDKAYGLGGFVHNPSIVPDPPGDGLNGPTIGSNDPYATSGGTFAPLMIERFTTVAGGTLKIYYNLSTWNPYTIVRMRSEFTITPPPQINAGGIVVHAGVTATVSPGALVDIYGSAMAAAAATAPAGPTLPTTLGGVQVLVNNAAAPLIYVSATQIIFQMPYEAAVGTAPVVVTSNGALSAPAPVTVQQAAPFILTYGANRAVVVNQDGSVNASGNGAKPGSVLVAYLIGSGPLDNAIATGAAAPLSPLSRETLAATVSVGGSSAVVQFAGMAPTFEGLMQMNFVTPNLAPGDYPMQVTIGGFGSNQPVVTVSK